MQVAMGVTIRPSGELISMGFAGAEGDVKGPSEAEAERSPVECNKA